MVTLAYCMEVNQLDAYIITGNSSEILDCIGISALVIDNSYGALFLGLGLPPAFTANLNLNYR